MRAGKPGHKRSNASNLAAPTSPVAQPDNAARRPPTQAPVLSSTAVAQAASAASSSEQYQRISHIEHIFRRPDTYLGSDEKLPRPLNVLENYHSLSSEQSQARIVQKTVTVPEAVERLFLEVLSNAGDNVVRSRERGVPERDIGAIEVYIEGTNCRIVNGGIPIPVERHPTEKLWTPELIFGHLLTSSNYDETKERTGIGRNGYGAKLVNIFSHRFNVTVRDMIRRRFYSQDWTDHMSVCNEAVVAPIAASSSALHAEAMATGCTLESNPLLSFVSVSWDVDFARFGLSAAGYDNDTIELFARHVLDLSLTCQVPVLLNGHRISAPDLSSYVRHLHFIQPSMNQTEWTSTIQMESKSYEYSVCFVDTPNQGQTISFVNGMATPYGGVHVDAFFKTVGQMLVDAINDSVGSNGSSSSSTNANSTRPKLVWNEVRPHLTMLIVIRLPNPKFDSQSKTRLTGPSFKIALEPWQRDLLNRIKTWNVFDRLQAELTMKSEKLFTKTDGKKRTHIDVARAEDANRAGGPQSPQCTLFIVEGKSAMGYAVKAISVMKGGRDFNGVYPMRGKPLNVMSATAVQISNNEEISDLKKMLGLCEGVNYEEPENFRKLRYGTIVLLTDADDDGTHIRALLLNLFHCRFASLLRTRRVLYLRTPVVRYVRGKKSLKFFSLEEYRRWSEATPANEVKEWGAPKYCKGLGSSTKEEILDDMRDPIVVGCIYDTKAVESLELAFHKMKSEERKRWLERCSGGHQQTRPSVAEACGSARAVQLHHDASSEESADASSNHSDQSFEVWSTNAGNSRLPSDDPAAEAIEGLRVAAFEAVRYKPQSISVLIERELGQYSKANIIRSIPLMIDGLKESQRKVLWGAFGYWGAFDANASQRRTLLVHKPKSIRVEQLAAEVARVTKYHHGGHCLDDVIIGMAQDFTGANNLAYFMQDGDFGTRNMGGKDAANSRYSATAPMPYLSYIFRREDIPLLTPLVEEGQTVEPKFLLPVIPMVLVNGATGVATGHSTFIPKHNPKEIIAWLRARLLRLVDQSRSSGSAIVVVPGTCSGDSSGSGSSILMPWYRGFRGTIEFSSKRVAMPAEALEDQAARPRRAAEDENVGESSSAPQPATLDSAAESSSQTTFSLAAFGPITPSFPKSIVTKGTFKVDENRVTITELPIGKWTHDYDERCKEFLQIKRIKNYANRSTDVRVNFELQGWAGPLISETTLGLRRTFPLTNMVLLDPKYRPQNFATTTHILEEFVGIRLEYYALRKAHQLHELGSQISSLDVRRRFIRCILDGTIVLFNRKKQDVLAEMKRLNIDPKVADRINILAVTEDDVEQLEQSILALEEEATILRRRTPEEIWLTDLEQLEQVIPA